MLQAEATEALIKQSTVKSDSLIEETHEDRPQIVNKTRLCATFEDSD